MELFVAVYLILTSSGIASFSQQSELTNFGISSFIVNKVVRDCISYFIHP